MFMNPCVRANYLHFCCFVISGLSSLWGKSVSHYCAVLCNMCFGVGEYYSNSPFQSSVVTPSCYSFENMTQLSTCQKQDKLIQMWLLDLLWLFAGSINITIHIYSLRSFQAYFKNVSFSTTQQQSELICQGSFSLDPLFSLFMFFFLTHLAVFISSSVARLGGSLDDDLGPTGGTMSLGWPEKGL